MILSDYHAHALQVAIAQCLFAWWWDVNRGSLFDPDERPTWDDANEEAQAFWMEGACRVMATELELKS